MVCSSVLLAMMGLAPTAPILLALRMVQGALSGTVFSAQALVASAVPERETGRAMGLLQMSVFMGATLGPVGGGAVADLLGFRSAYAAAGVLLASATVVVFLFVREPRRAPRHAVEEAHPPVLSLFAAPAFVAALALTLGVQLAGTSLFPIIPLYVQDLLHNSREVAADAGWLMALSGLAGGAGSYLAGRLQRPIGLHRLLGVALLLSALLLAPQALAGGFIPLLVVRTLFGFAFGALIGLVGTLSAVSSPRRAKGTAFGLVGAASSLGFGSGPLMGGALAAGIGLRPLFVVAAVLLLIAPAVLFGFAMALTSLLRASSLVPRWEAEGE
jgi:DHA1 family multidrug resistance protein-like MFS transporter